MGLLQENQSVITYLHQLHANFCNRVHTVLIFFKYEIVILQLSHNLSFIVSINLCKLSIVAVETNEHPHGYNV